MLKPQYSLAHHVCLEILFILTYTIRPSYRKYGFVVVALPALYALCFTKLTGAMPGAFIDMGLGARLGQILLFSSNDFLLHNAQQEYRAIGDTRDISSAPFITRLRWAVQVWANPRGIGWTHEAKGLPPKTKEMSRARFMRGLAVESVLWMAAYDVNKWVLRQSPYYTQGQKLEGWQSLWRLSACGYAFNIIIKLGMQRSQLALICLSLGVTEPRDWPQTFGSLKYTYSLAAFWGKCWHTIFKNAFVGHAKFVNDALHIRKDGWLGGLLGLVVIFTLSALVHAAGDYVMIEDLSNTSGVFAFFLMQVPALLLEQLLVAIARQLGIRRANWFTYFIGYVWVFSWCAISLPYWIDMHVHRGYWDSPMERYGPFMMLWRGAP